MVAARLSKLNYRIKRTQGRESVVHVNRMKRSYKQGTLRVKGKGRSYRKHQTRGQEPEEEDPAILAPGPIQIPTPPANCNTVTTHQLRGDDSLRDPMTTADSGQIPKMTQHGKGTRRSCLDLNVTIHCYRK